MTKNGWQVSVSGARRVRALNKHPLSACMYSDLFPGWQVENEIAKPRVSIDSNNSLIDCKNCNRKGHLQPEIESNEYSSSKKLLE